MTDIVMHVANWRA